MRKFIFQSIHEILCSQNVVAKVSDLKLIINIDRHVVFWVNKKSSFFSRLFCDHRIPNGLKVRAILGAENTRFYPAKISEQEIIPCY